MNKVVDQAVEALITEAGTRVQAIIVKAQASVTVERDKACGPGWNSSVWQYPQKEASMSSQR